MKILVMPKPIEGVSREELLQHSAEEIKAVWQLYIRGICREFYTRANEAGRVVLMFEGDWHPQLLSIGQFESVEQALRWYNSEEYAPAKALRFKVAKNQAIVVQGL